MNNPDSFPEPRKRMTKRVRIMPKIPNTALAPVPEPETLTVENISQDKEPRQPLERHCSNCKGLSHNILQCPSRPCNYCKNSGHVSTGCPIRLSINKVKVQKRKAESRENQSLIKWQSYRLNTWLEAQEPPSKRQASSASQVLLTAADQPLRTEAEVDVEMTEDQLHDPEHDTQDANTKSAEDMEIVQ